MKVEHARAWPGEGNRGRGSVRCRPLTRAPSSGRDRLVRAVGGSFADTTYPAAEAGRGWGAHRPCGPALCSLPSSGTATWRSPRAA